MLRQHDWGVVHACGGADVDAGVDLALLCIAAWHSCETGAADDIARLARGGECGGAEEPIRLARTPLSLGVGDGRAHTLARPSELVNSYRSASNTYLTHASCTRRPLAPTVTTVVPRSNVVVLDRVGDELP